MMLLCPNHHDQATKRAMPEAEQRSHKSNPYNIRHNRAKGMLAVKQDYCAASFGSVDIVGQGAFLVMADEPILGLALQDGQLEISVKLYSLEDRLLLEIEGNEWVSGDPLPWDIEASWQRLILRERVRNISLSIDASQVPASVKGRFYRGGRVVTIDEHGIEVDGSRGVSFSDMALVGMQIVVRLENKGCIFTFNEANPHGVIVSWPNRRERLWKAKAAWKKIQTMSRNSSSTS
jgi:hypothetical protein